MSREDDASTATRLVSGAIGFTLTQVCIGVGGLQLVLDHLTGTAAHISLEGRVVFGSGTASELSCEPPTIAALERLLPALNNALEAALVRVDGSLRLSFGGVTIDVPPDQQYESWSYRGPAAAGDSTVSGGRIFCVGEGRLDLYLDP